MTSNLAARVALGVEFLDNARPDWAAHIEPDRLAMEDYNRCVVSQLYGDSYTHGMRMLGLTLDDGFAHGFDSMNGSEEYRVLTDLWRAEVTKRQRRVRRQVPPKPRKTRPSRPRYVQSAEVSVIYAPGQNVSVTKRGGAIVKVTTWTTGVPSSTKRH